jgi:hypothetical protein
MEHRFDAGDDLDDVLESLVDENGADAFDAYLRRKAERICISPSASELSPIDVEGLSSSPASDAADVSSSATSSEAEGTGEASSSSDAPGVDDKATELRLHSHAIVGAYVTEATIELKVDEEWKRVFIETHAVSVQELTAEQVIERFHKLERTVFLIRAQQQGLRLALGDLLALRNAKDRSALLEMERELRLQNNRKAKDKVKKQRESKGEPKSGTTAKASSAGKGKSKGEKTADTLKSLMMDKPSMIQLIKTQNLWDDRVSAYVDKLFA